MKTCVTGGAGFIGSNLVDRLIADGHRVVVLDNLSTGRLENLAGALPRIEFVQGDLRDPGDVARAVAGCEVVYHQGALASVARSVENPVEVTEVNVMGTLNLLFAARDAKVRRVVFASSSSVYGDTPELPKTETMPTTPRSPYAASKAAGESYLSAFQAAYGLETVALRYFNVYGPRQAPDSVYAAAVPRFIDAMANGRPATIYGDGGQTRDFTYVADVVDALVRAATSVKAPLVGPMNVGGGRRISILDLVGSIAKAFGYAGRPIHEPARAGDVRDSLADIRRAMDALAWKPATPLDQGIARLVAVAQRAHAPAGPNP